MSAAPAILLFNDECGVCRRIAQWVDHSALRKFGAKKVRVQPIGEDPEVLHDLSPGLSIWDAYATIHLLMPDGTVRLGGEAVAEVFRDLPRTQWFAWLFGVRVFKFRPFQAGLNLAYAVLADIRPLFGCESCGRPVLWVRPLAWLLKKAQRMKGMPPHFTKAPQKVDSTF